MDYTLDINRLAELRKGLGVTKQHAAKMMNMAQPTYLRYENGERHPSLHTIRTLAEAFDTSVDYLIGKTDDPRPDHYVVSKADDAEVFALLEKLNGADEKQKKRLLAYAEKIFG